MDDLISRQAAIDAICEDGTQLERQGQYSMTMAERKQRDADILDALPSVQPYTDAEIQTMQDLEQAELDKAFELGKEEGRKEVPHWIPCSERMPEEHDWIGTKKFGTTISDEVYVTFENPKGERFCKHLSFQNGKLSAFDKSTIDAFFKGSKPIAWMSLPKAYKEEQ